MTDTVPMKVCSKCDKPYPATREHFYADSRTRDKLETRCKKCVAENGQKYRQNNKEKIAEYQRQYQKDNAESLREYQKAYQKKWSEDNKEQIAERKHRYYLANRESKAEYSRDYQFTNKEGIAAYQKRYYQENRDYILERKRQWKKDNPDKVEQSRIKYYQANRDKILESNRQYRERYPEKARVISRIMTRRRKARKRQLPDTFTVSEWERCLEFFGHSCAVCEVHFESVASHADHWLALATPDCPGTIATNMVCLCQSCNWEKNNKPPTLWLTERYGTRKANQILARIETYFAWVLSQNNQEGKSA